MNLLEKIDKKFVIMNAPFVAIWYVINKITYLYRITDGNSTKKMQALVTDFGSSFDPVWPSFHLVDVLVGVVVIAVIKLKISVDRSNKKHLREGEEAGSARWGTKEDIKPFMSDNPFDNVILSNSEGLTMKKPLAFKYGRNKNVEVIGGSGAGKTFCYIKSNLMQLHSSYVVTDPNGYNLVG